MGKKKDCFGSETYVCMTPNCPYAKECIDVVWQKRLERVISKRRGDKPAAEKRAPGRLTVKR